MSLLLLALGYANQRVKSADAGAREFQHNITARLSREAALRDSALKVGDWLPRDLKLSRPNGGDVLFSSLAADGYHYVYLYRRECSGCASIRPALDSASTAHRRAIAFVEYRPREDVRDHDRAAAFGVLAASTSSAPSLTQFVPALIEIDRNGRIQSIADGVEPVLRTLRARGISDDRILAEQFPSRNR